MKAKNLFNVLLAAASAAVLFASCDGKEEEPGVGFNDATLTLSLVSVENTSATFSRSSSGVEGATYYGFVTEDLTSDASALIAAKVRTLSVNKHIVKAGNTTDTVEGLRQGGKQYRYILTGLTSAGNVYGSPIEVIFSTGGDYKVNSAWSFSFDDPVAAPQDLTIKGIEGTYVSALVTKEEWDATTIGEIVNKTLDGKYTAESGNKTVSLPLEESGDYVFYAFGVAEDGAPTLDYGKYDIAFDVNSLDFSVYESYLGEYYLGGDKDVVVKISELVKGKTYSVDGFPGSDDYAPFVANFDNAKGEIYVMEQDLDEYEHPSYGPCTDELCGIFEYNGKQYLYWRFNSGENSPSLLFTAVRETNGDLTLTPGECPYGTFVAMNYAWNILTGANAGKGNKYEDSVELPNSLTVEPAYIEPEAAYTTYINTTWYTSDGLKLNFAEGEVNETLILKGLGEDVEVAYEEGVLYFYTSDVLSTDEDGYDWYFVGIDQDGFAETAAQNSDDPYFLASASLGEDGKSIEFEGAAFKAEYRGKTYNQVISGFQIVGYQQDETITGTTDVAGIVDPWYITYTPPTYESYLGTWSDGTYDWIIEEKEAGKTYTVSDVLTAYDFGSFEGKFDSETGRFSLSEQLLTDEVSIWEHPSYGTCQDILSGIFSANGSTYYAFPTVNSPDTTNELFQAAAKQNGTLSVYASDFREGIPFVATARRWVITQEDCEYKGQGNFYSGTTLPIPTRLTPVSEEAAQAKSVRGVAAAKLADGVLEGALVAKIQPVKKSVSRDGIAPQKGTSKTDHRSFTLAKLVVL